MSVPRSACPKGGLHDFQPVSHESVCSKCDRVAIIPHAAQIKLLKSRADIAIFGGAKGGGKSFSLLLGTTRHLGNGQFGAAIFRREGTQIHGQGGLWDTSELIYPHVGGNPMRYRNTWSFPSGAKVQFAHLSQEKDVRAWDGKQVPLIGFDELTHFSIQQFFYMLTINRSTCGVRPYIRATCNPDSDSWVASFLEWWIDQQTGYPIRERAGVLRWFVRDQGELIWGDTREELVARFPKQLPKSVTFVPARLEDNPTLERIDPGYRANLLAQDLVQQERLLKGNWKIRPAVGLKFPADKWVHKPAAPPNLRLIRFWDKAYTEGGKGARTAGVLMGELDEDEARTLGLPRFWIVDAKAGRWGDAQREATIKATGILDNQMHGHVTVGLEQEGGAGKHSANMTVANLAGLDVFTERPVTNKSLRWTPLAAQQQIGNVAIVEGNWPWAQYINELDNLAGDEVLDRGKLKDLADASAGAFKWLVEASVGGYIQGDLIASGDPEYGDEETGLYTERDKDTLTPFLRELVDEADGLADDRDDRW